MIHKVAIGRRTVKQVEIRVKGCVDKHWSSWFSGLTITYTEQGETLLTGSIKDQAELYGVLASLRDLGLELLSVTSTKPEL